VFAVAGDTVGVREGSYFESFIPKNGVAILGGFNSLFTNRDPTLHETTLTSNGRVVTCLGGVGQSAIIDGFTMAGGGGEVGGLVYLSNCSPTLSHCRFVGAIGGRGGSVHLENSPSLLLENVFTGNSSSEVGGALAVFSCNGTVIRNCRFAGNVSTSGGGAVFLNESTAIRIANCVFIENRAGNHGGGLLVQLSVAQVDSCLFVRNTCPGNGGAVAGYAASNPLITRSTLVANEAAGGGGVFCNLSSQMTVTRSIVANNTGNGLQLEIGGDLINSCNDTWNNTPGNYQNVAPGPNSISLDPLFCDAAVDNYRIEHESPCAPEQSPVCGLIGAFPATCGGILIRVPDDHASIVLAINAAQGGDTVAVAEGHYLEHVTLRSEVKLLGGWRSDFTVRDPLAYPTVIDAGGFLSAVVAQNDETRTAVIDGFVITGGYLPDDFGGGIYCFDSSPTISNNVLLNNRAGQGAAIGCRGSSAPVIVGNVLVGNKALDAPGGAIYVENVGRIESNTLDGNDGPFASGVVVRAGGRPIITRNIIVNGLGGVGVFADQGAAPITSCNDVWQNAGGEYFGVLPGPNSFSLDPLFCPGEARFLNEESPCVGGPCGLIGARGVGCGTVAVDPLPGVPARSWLGPSFPNPMRGSAVLSFGLAQESKVQIAVFDLAGRTVRMLVNEVRPAGEHRIGWDSRIGSGGELPCGVYFYELTAEGARIGRGKITVVR
jgi:hypothetical protein